VKLGYLLSPGFKWIRWYLRIQSHVHFFDKRYSLSSNESLTPFFILGCGRSGSTLLRTMLTKDPQIVIPPESYVLPKIIRKFYRKAYLPWNQLTSMVINGFEKHPEFSTWNISLEKTLQSCQALPEKQQSLANIIEMIYLNYGLHRVEKSQQFIPQDAMIWGDKTPKNSQFIDHIQALFPKAKYIHLIRDPRAVFASYIKSGLASKKSMNEADYIVWFWLKAHGTIEKNKKNLGKECFLVIHYEDLIRQPKSTMQSVCDYLGVDFQESMLKFWLDQENLGDVEKYHHHRNTQKPIDVKNIGKWKYELSPEQIKFVENHCLKLYQSLCRDYPLRGVAK